MLADSNATLAPKGLARLAAGFKRLQLKTILNTILFLMVVMFVGLAAMVHFQVAETTFLALLAGLSLITLVSGAFLNRHITRPMKYIQEKLDQIAEGNYFDWVENDRDDEIGQMLQSLKSTQIKLV